MSQKIYISVTFSLSYVFSPKGIFSIFIQFMWFIQTQSTSPLPLRGSSFFQCSFILVSCFIFFHGLFYIYFLIFFIVSLPQLEYQLLEDKDFGLSYLLLYSLNSIVHYKSESKFYDADVKFKEFLNSVHRPREACAILMPISRLERFILLYHFGEKQYNPRDESAR